MVGASKPVPGMGQPASAPDGVRAGGRGTQPNRTWAGRGSGARCDLCHLRIDEDQIEYEVEVGEARNRIITLHLACYEQWTLSGDSLERLSEDL